jgi:hypothetical protein
MLHKQELRDEENKREREAAKLREEEFKRRDEEQQRKINQLLGYAIETKATVDVAAALAASSLAWAAIIAALVFSLASSYVLNSRNIFSKRMKYRP